MPERKRFFFVDPFPNHLEHNHGHGHCHHQTCGHDRDLYQYLPTSRRKATSYAVHIKQPLFFLRRRFRPKFLADTTFLYPGLYKGQGTNLFNLLLELKRLWLDFCGTHSKKESFNVHTWKKRPWHLSYYCVISLFLFHQKCERTQKQKCLQM